MKDGYQRSDDFGWVYVSGSPRRSGSEAIALLLRGLLRGLYDAAAYLLGKLNRALIAVSTLFGVHIVSPQRRYAVLMGIYLVVFLVGSLPIPVLPLAALAFGYIGVLAVNRAWSANEEERNAIAKKLQDGEPDQLPDLRSFALVSAIMLVILFPLIFRQLQWQFDCYKLPPTGTDFGGWMLFTLDSYNKSFLGFLELYGIHINHIGYESTWGRHIVMLCRLTFDFLLIQGIMRLFAIHAAVRDAVAAVATDPNLAVRMGKRAVKPLIAALRGAGSGTTENIAMALGKLKDPRAVEPLIGVMLHLLDKDAAREAIVALGELRDPRALEPLIDTVTGRIRMDTEMRREAVVALAKLKDPRAVEPLIVALNENDEQLRLAASVALGVFKDPRAVEPLIGALKHTDPDVRRAAAGMLGAPNDPRAIEPLAEALKDDDQRVRVHAAESLAKLKDPRAVEPLIEALNADGIVVRSIAGEALHKLKESHDIELLLEGIKDKDVRERMAKAIKDFRYIGPVFKYTGLLGEV
jgi:HEAT repeat protein